MRNNNKEKKICFFVKLDSDEYLKRVGFYKQDIEILTRIGYKVMPAISFKDLFKPTDVYYVWWWTWAFIPVFLGLIRRKPVIITGVFDHYIDGEIQDYIKRNIIHRLLLKFSLKYCSVNLFISHLEKDQIKKYFGNVKSKVSHLAINESLFFHRNDINREEQLLFTISWLTKENAKRKKLFEIIHAMPTVLQKFPKIKLVIAGKKNSAYEDLLEAVTKLNLNQHIKFTDAISEEEKIKYLQTCSVYLQPTEVEGFGLAILEAMFCGAPIISTKTGTVPEVMGNGGIYVEKNTSEDIAEAIITLLSSRELANEVSHNAILRAKKFSYEKRIKEMQGILQDVLKNDFCEN
jgi:glycosyltransferase involved in cell wall biosynthesis